MLAGPWSASQFLHRAGSGSAGESPGDLCLTAQPTPGIRRPSSPGLMVTREVPQAPDSCADRGWEGRPVDTQSAGDEDTNVHTDPPLDPQARSEATLVKGAQRWMLEALDAWSEEDEARISLLAPMAV